MDRIIFNLPGKLVFGNGCLDDFLSDFTGLPFRRVFIVADPFLQETVARIVSHLEESGLNCSVWTGIYNEPTVNDFKKVRAIAESHGTDSVVGIGGGSVMDVAKLTAALCFAGTAVESVFGTGKIRGRKAYLCCLPTTAGTGSEVSPNSILLDEASRLKMAVISPFLVPDSTYVDPELTHTVPPGVTASTGLDALTHCIEAFANRNSHPMVDLYALEGIRLIYSNLENAVLHGSDVNARRAVALGSLYGGMCLGPVNTAAVHALAYPLGIEYKIAHGVSNAILLPHVLAYNVETDPEKYAVMAKAVGEGGNGDVRQTASEGINAIARLCRNLGIPQKLSQLNIPVSAVTALAKQALGVQRLLKNNLRELTESDIRDIYYKLF